MNRLRTLDPEERAEAIGRFVASDTARFLASVEEVPLGEAAIGYNRSQVDRVLGNLSGIVDTIAAWDGSGEVTDHQAIRLMSRIPDIRFEEERPGYDHDQVDELLRRVYEGFLELIDPAPEP